MTGKGRDSIAQKQNCVVEETRTTTWNLPGPSGRRDCIVYLSHPSPLLCGG